MSKINEPTKKNSDFRNGAVEIARAWSDGRVAASAGKDLGHSTWGHGAGAEGRAIRWPERSVEPKLVQAAVKRCIFGLVALDAVLSVAFVGWPGLAILLLLFPAGWLGKWVYST